MGVMTARPTRRVLAAIALLGVAACAAMHREDRPEPPTDGNVIAMFLAANNTDISYAQVAMAPGRTTTAPVLGFAHRMLDDHTGLAQAARDLIAKTNIDAEDNITSLDFRDESAAERDTLRELSGAKFDSAYMANEVRYHTRLLTVLDSVLIPAAHNGDLKSLLAGVRPAVAAHLEHAERVQSGLGK
jgi:putative membrane protein